ncbi:MAG: hypothetical protein AYK18_17450 [Theionarchaea archaeon DG-70]|nr:MAG: hypothetical protein AYK18_17450 [Theionarchaea archaeon DG-70]
MGIDFSFAVLWQWGNLTTLRNLERSQIRLAEIFDFLGPNAAGKSTTQKILIGLLKGYRGMFQFLEET